VITTDHCLFANEGVDGPRAYWQHYCNEWECPGAEGRLTRSRDGAAESSVSATDAVSGIVIPLIFVGKEVVFVSYTSQDVSVADAIVATLRRNGLGAGSLP